MSQNQLVEFPQPRDILLDLKRLRDQRWNKQQFIIGQTFDRWRWRQAEKVLEIVADLAHVLMKR